ncbi:MAG: hypothetical protein JOZ62_06095 [Acidobacteriaceae bacterium]|nr:hypothetical protein [Acidobacteriaceae bacterium]
MSTARNVETSCRSKETHLFFARWAFIAIGVFSCADALAAARCRVTTTINHDWTFQYFPAPEPSLSPASPGYSDATWPAIALPHTWSTYETTHDLHPFIKVANEEEDTYWWYGCGWYRKRIGIDARYKNRLISLEFDGVQKYSKVFVNGRLAGEHKGGYTSFSVDITPYVNFGGENLMAVLVSNRRDDPNAIPPMTAGNFDVYGGIYRDVRLVIKDRLHIPFQGSADHEGGTFITTPRVSDTDADVQVQTWVRNDYSVQRDCILVTTIRDAAARVVAETRAQQTIQPSGVHEFAQTVHVSHPHLWSPDQPYVYSVHSEVRADQTEADEMNSPLGFRWFSWNKPEHRLYLNGRVVLLHGTNRHQEYPWLGDAMPKWMHKRDLEDIRDNLGHNFQRTVHYPNDPYVYELSDRLGIITIEEVPNIKDIAFNRDVQHQNVIEMIRRDRNHPGIFFWSMGNETNQPADSAWGWAEDKTRIINLRRGTNGGAYVQTTEEDLALESLLRCTIRGWHDGDREFPDGGHPKSGQVTGTEEWQHDVNRAEIIRRKADNIVIFLYADHGADRKYLYAPLLYVNPKGWVDAYRNPKYMYYLWEANFGHKPVLFIEQHNWRPRYLGTKKDITVDSNCDSVTLSFNGRALGTLQPSAENGHSVTFHNISVEQGMLSADGACPGQTVHEELPMPGDPAAITLMASSDSIPTGRDGIATVSARIVDAHGVYAMGANPPLTWKVKGPGKLVGPPLYQTDTLKNGAREGTMYIDTPVSNVIRSQESAGIIELSVEAPGMKSGQVSIRAVEPGRNEIDGISEPVLSDAGRIPVTRDRAFKPAVVASKPAKLKELGQDYTLSPTPDGSYDTAVRDFILQRNPGVNTSTPEFRAMVNRLASDLARTHGHLIADDYNFQVRQFNDKRTRR